MAQQPQTAAQYRFGPSNGGGDILHFIPANSNPDNAQGLIGYIDKNGLNGGLQGNTNALVVGAPAAIAETGAATAVFSTVPLSLPGNGAYEQLPFTIRAAGWVSLNGGTYTATIQPFVYASTSAGFTASVAAAILSAAAVNVTIAVAAAATLTYFPWEVEILVSGDSTSGLITGHGSGQINNNGAVQKFPATAANATWDALVNMPTGVNFASATPPLQFLSGVGITGATVSAAKVNLGSFFLES